MTKQKKKKNYFYFLQFKMTFKGHKKKCNGIKKRTVSWRLRPYNPPGNTHSGNFTETMQHTLPQQGFLLPVATSPWVIQ